MANWYMLEGATRGLSNAVKSHMVNRDAEEAKEREEEVKAAQAAAIQAYMNTPMGQPAAGQAVPPAPAQQQATQAVQQQAQQGQAQNAMAVQAAPPGSVTPAGAPAGVSQTPMNAFALQRRANATPSMNTPEMQGFIKQNPEGALALMKTLQSLPSAEQQKAKAAIETTGLFATTALSIPPGEQRRQWIADKRKELSPDLRRAIPDPNDPNLDANLMALAGSMATAKQLTENLYTTRQTAQKGTESRKTVGARGAENRKTDSAQHGQTMKEIKERNKRPGASGKQKSNLGNINQYRAQLQKAADKYFGEYDKITMPNGEKKRLSADERLEIISRSEEIGEETGKAPTRAFEQAIGEYKKGVAGVSEKARKRWNPETRQVETVEAE